MRNPRVLVAVGVLLAAVVVAVVIFVASDSDDGADSLREGPRRVPTARARLTLEQATVPNTGQAELLVSLPDARLNNLRTSGGATMVLLRCASRTGEQTVRQKWKWPLLDELGFRRTFTSPRCPMFSAACAAAG